MQFFEPTFGHTDVQPTELSMVCQIFNFACIGTYTAISAIAPRYHQAMRAK